MTPDERFVATPGGYLVETSSRGAEALPVGRPVAADDGRSVAVVDPKGVVWLNSRVLWTDRVAVWTSEGVLHALEIATHAHHEALVRPKEAFVPTAPSEDGPDPIAPEALAVAPDLVAVLGPADRLEVRGDTLGAPRWTRASVASFAVSIDGADVAVVEPPRDPARPDLRLRVVGAKDGAVKASLDVGPDQLVHEQKRGRFTGACGGGSFRATAVRGTLVTLHRECSLLDVYDYGVAKDRIVREEHHTPAEDVEDARRVTALCARTRTKDCPPDPYPSWLVERRVAAVSSETATHLFDVTRQRRIGTLDLAVDASSSARRRRARSWCSTWATRR